MNAELGIYCCFNCGNHICFHNDIFDKNYVSGRRRAFLLSHAKNIVMGSKENKQLISGTYLIADASCSECGEKLGWKYFEANQEEHKHKEGKFVIVYFKIIKLCSWC
ncbi:protein yippee-like At4g27745 [Mercurialis annua]|uniref:protein yippee-like At4g27745 n=1 Tax=Mercurialis annua TaxID=3986 RepID=UPI00215ED351|nr:protein yippee-like At4g27745 [Mercurialis annua]